MSFVYCFDLLCVRADTVQRTGEDRGQREPIYQTPDNPSSTLKPIRRYDVKKGRRAAASVGRRADVAVVGVLHFRTGGGISRLLAEETRVSAALKTEKRHELTYIKQDSTVNEDYG